MAVTDMADHHAAQRPRHEADGEDAVGRQKLRHRVLAGKEGPADHGSEVAVDGKVVPFEHVADGAGGDELGRASHRRSAAISAGLRPASDSTLSVCSPRAETFGPLCTFDPENRKGGAGERNLPALSSISHREPRWATCGSCSASVTVR